MKKHLPKIKINRKIWYFIISFLVIAGIILTIFFIHKRTQTTVNSKDKLKLECFFKVIEKELRVHPNIGLKYLDSATIIVNNLNDDTYKARILIYKGAYELNNKGNIEESIKIINQAWAIAKKINNDRIFAMLKNIRANCYFNEGEYVKAFVLYTEALQYFERVNDKKYIAIVYNNLGIIFMNLKQTHKAIEYFNKSLNINEIEDSYIKLSILSNLGACYYNLKSYTVSTNYLYEALKGFSELRDSIGIIKSLINIGNNYMSEANVEKARICFRQVNEYAVKVNNKYLIALALINLGDVYMKMNDLVQAKTFYEKGLKLSQKEGYMVNKIEALLPLSTIEKKLKNWEKALKLQTQYIDTKDSSMNGEIQKKITELQMQYQIEKKQQEAKLKQQRRDFLTLIVVLLLISGIISTILLLSRQRIKMKNIRLEKKQLSDEIESKNRELIINVMNLLKKNEFIDEATNQLLEIEKTPIDEKSKKSILNMVHKLQKSSEEDTWKEFELRFKEVHNDFYERLILQFHDLTPSELKLCALLRLNLTTKEICNLTGQMPSSLDVARYRLRKKLGISNSSVNLISFLSQL